MQQKLVPTLTIKKVPAFHNQQKQSLHILACNHVALQSYLQTIVSSNPYLHYSIDLQNQDSDAFLAYQHETRRLYDEIMEQVHLSKHTLDDDICEYLIQALDSNGYFQVNLQTLCKQSSYSKSQITHHLAILRTFEPHGTFAFHLKDCLQIQCKLSRQPDREIGFILCDYLDDIALHQRTKLKQKTQLTDLEIDRGIAFIQSLNPKPAANYAQDVTYLIPEIKIQVIQNKFHFELLQYDLQIESDLNEMHHLNQELRALKQAAQALIHSVQKRNLTILLIMQTICEYQKDFFLKQAPLKPCTLDIIAKKCDLHTSTIARAIQNKTCEFNHTYYPIQAFFSSGGFEEHTKESIMEKIKHYINMEDKRNPDSDETLRKRLEQDGIFIARRTVTKYREKLLLFNSQKRKQD